MYWVCYIHTVYWCMYVILKLRDYGLPVEISMGVVSVTGKSDHSLMEAPLMILQNCMLYTANSLFFNCSKFIFVYVHMKFNHCYFCKVPGFSTNCHRAIMWLNYHMGPGSFCHGDGCYCDRGGLTEFSCQFSKTTSHVIVLLIVFIYSSHLVDYIQY